MSTTSIQWTEQTWNPVAGCSIVSPGCTHCYAMRMAARLEAMGKKKYVGLTKKVKSGKKSLPVWTGKIALDDDALAIPLKRKKPTIWFVNSMSDLFHEGVPFDFVDRVFAVMALTPRHTYQILTKRPERMAEYLAANDRTFSVENVGWSMINRPIDLIRNWPLHNAWLGTSIEDQKHANERYQYLRKCAAKVRFFSAEPLLGPIYKLPLVGIDWVIVGGESGPGARPCEDHWIRSIVEQCKAVSRPVFVKQLGAQCYATDYVGASPPYRFKDAKGGDPSEWPEDLRVREMPTTFAESTR